MKGPSLLLHACCAPCAGSVIESLGGEFVETVYFCNPNIAPQAEYALRRDEVRRLCGIEGLSMIEAPDLLGPWNDRVAPYASEGERSPRCWECYRFRLETLFTEAVRLKADAAATTLGISPHKDFAMLCEIGREMEKKFGVPYIDRNFRKNEGYRRSVEITAKFGFHRQDYCGCLHSLRERDARLAAKKNI